jgi:hypothetical protein
MANTDAAVRIGDYFIRSGRGARHHERPTLDGGCRQRSAQSAVAHQAGGDGLKHGRRHRA